MQINQYTVDLMTVTRIYSEVREKVARWAKLNMYNQGKLTGMVAVDESMFGSVVDQHPRKKIRSLRR